MPDETPEAPLLTVTLTRAELVDFASAIGESRAEYVDAEAARRAGHPDVLAAPTYLICLTLRADDPWDWAREGGLDMARTLHGEQSFDYDRLVHAGDRLTLAATTEPVEPAIPGLRRLRRRIRITGDHGPVATLVTTLVMKEPDA